MISINTNKNISLNLKVSQGAIISLIIENKFLKKKEISSSIIVTSGSLVLQRAVIQGVTGRRDNIVSMVMSEKAIIKNNIKVVPNVIVEFLLINYYQSFYMFDLTIAARQYHLYQILQSWLKYS